MESVCNHERTVRHLLFMSDSQFYSRFDTIATKDSKTRRRVTRNKTSTFIFIRTDHARSFPGYRRTLMTRRREPCEREHGHAMQEPTYIFTASNRSVFASLNRVNTVRVSSDTSCFRPWPGDRPVFLKIGRLFRFLPRDARSASAVLLS